MNHRIGRRTFLKTAGAVTAGIGLTGQDLAAAEPASGAPHAEKLGWHLGCQAYTFKEFTFHEAVKKVASLGLHYVEMFPGQMLSDFFPGQKADQSMPADVRQTLKNGLAKYGVKLANYGVCKLPHDEAACRKTFDFARDMGIQTLVAEPDFQTLDMVEKLCDEYQINVAIHNHPKPSRYWDYKTVLQQCKGRGKRIGSCADTGHWMRSGINPLEAIQALEGRIVSFHFKDLNEFGVREAHDVPWGTGKADIKAILTEIHRQKIQAVFSIEYEYNWLNSLPEIAKSVQYFDQVAAELATA